MSDKILALRHKKALATANPGTKEYLEEWAKKSINITAQKKWQESGEPFEEDDEVLGIYNILKHYLLNLQHSENIRKTKLIKMASVGEVIRTKSAGKSI